MPPRRSVFVVDDDPSMRTSMTRLLREYGFEATLFDSPSALLGHGEFGGVSCVVLDIDLNGESGIELRRRLADQGVKVPVIYITGNDTDMIRSAATNGCGDARGSRTNEALCDHQGTPPEHRLHMD